jgi:hypothetical protein
LSHILRATEIERANLPDMHAAALAYAAGGLRVFPVKNKRPLIKEWPRRASSDVARINNWWKRWPSADVGTPMGYGLVAIDFDPGSADPTTLGLPTTLASRTPRGGQHLFFKTADVFPNRVNHVFPNTDIRSKGGFVVLPPSRGYEWVDADVLPAPLPAWVKARALAPKERAAQRAFGPGFEPRERVGEGERNDYIARYAGYALRMGVEEAELFDCVMAHNNAVCVPPLDKIEVERTTASIARAEVRNGGR